MTLNLSLWCDFQWTFIVTDVTPPILSMGFLHHYGLLINIKRQQLIDTKTEVKYIGCLKSVLSPKVVAAEFLEILSNYQDITEPKFNTYVIKYDIKHCTETSGPPVFSQPCQLDPDKLKIAKPEFQHLAKLGVICSMKSKWSSPLYMVPKQKSFSWRFCGDYHKLNAITLPDRYHIAIIQDFTTQLHGTKIFDKLDSFDPTIQYP